jgi:1-deoxy-D-xylulose-5-phosphate synthase
VIRYPNGRGVRPEGKTPMKELETGKARMIRDGKDVAILTIGHPGNHAAEACVRLASEGISAAHFDMRFLKPMDEGLIHDILKRFSRILTIEDGVIMGGFGSAVLEFVNDHHYTAYVKRLGIPDRFVEQGSVAELHRECGYDVQGIVMAVKEMMLRAQSAGHRDDCD